MVRGIDIFKHYFGAYPENYVIIGGTACDILMEDAGFTPRATKDIDLILIVEALTPEFVEKFWGFVKDGAYERQEKSTDERKYYRFIKPENKDFPFQIELFSRTPDNVDLKEPGHLTPIPVDDDLSSLSAILMNDDYYNYMRENCVQGNGLQLANLDALICLKAKAFLEISERIAAGGKEDAKHLKKHKNDVFKLAAMLPTETYYELPASIKKQLNEFLQVISQELPDKQIFKDMGLPTLTADKIIDQITASFKLNDEQVFAKEINALKQNQTSPVVKIERSPALITETLEEAYFPLLNSLNEQLSGFDSLFKESTWTYFKEPKAPDHKIPLLPEFAQLTPIENYFRNVAHDGGNSIHNYKAAYWLMDYQDQKRFSLEVALKIHFLKDEYRIEIAIGQPFESSRMIEFFRNLVKTITKDNELFGNFKQVDLVTNEYGKAPTTEDINKWALEIRNLTLEVIKEKSNANNPNA